MVEVGCGDEAMFLQRAEERSLTLSSCETNEVHGSLVRVSRELHIQG